MARRGSDPRDALAHLRQNRGKILERSAVVALAGMLPLPAIDDLLAGAARTTLLRLIAESRSVDADEAALAAVAAAALRGALPGGGFFAASRVVMRGRLRRLIALFNAAGRADDLASTFAVATLFDHYCARHHVGLGLDQPRGRLLAVAIERSVVDARFAVARRGASRVARTATTALSAAPAAVRALVGRATPLLPGDAPGPAVPDPVDPGEAPRARAAGNVAERTLAAIAELFDDAGRAWIEELTSAFDARWAGHAGA